MSGINVCLNLSKQIKFPSILNINSIFQLDDMCNMVVISQVADYWSSLKYLKKMPCINRLSYLQNFTFLGHHRYIFILKLYDWFLSYSKLKFQHGQVLYPQGLLCQSKTLHQNNLNLFRIYMVALMVADTPYSSITTDTDTQPLP